MPDSGKYVNPGGSEKSSFFPEQFRLTYFPELGILSLHSEQGVLDMYAERNREIKKLLTKAFGCKVSVRGSRGTATGWVTVDIDYRPRTSAERDELRSKVWELFRAAKIEIGTYGYDDPGSDYGHGSKIHLNFGRPLDVFIVGERVEWNGMPGTVADVSYSPPDWYMIKWDNGDAGSFYKSDLRRI